MGTTIPSRCSSATCSVALRAGQQAVMWLTKDGVNVAVKGYVDTISVAGAPSIPELHAEYVERGGRFFACPVCVKTHGLEGSDWVDGSEVKGAPALYEFTQGGALTFNLLTRQTVKSCCRWSFWPEPGFT
jgi:predicted peroxiredoxin